MEEWKEYKLEEIGKITTGKTPQTAIKEYFGGEICFVTPADINSPYKYVNETDRYLTEDGLNSIVSNSIEEGSICVSCIGNIGYAGIVRMQCASNQQINSITVKEEFDRDYIYYSIKNLWPFFKNYEGQSTTLSILNKGQFSKISVKCPSLETQKRIAAILSSLDDKIEVNRRINDNLEQQVLALFDEMIMDEKLPRNKVLKDYAYINPSRTVKKGEVKRYIDMSSLPTKGSFPSDWINKPYNGGMKFQNGDTIMARITPCLENGKTAYINFLEKDEVAFGSTEYIVMAPHDGIPSEMFYFLARNEDFVAYAVAHMNGSSGRQRVSATDIENYIMPDIPTHSIVIFGKKANAVMECIKNNSLENRKLSSLRDTLLPRLMSGELSVNDIEE